MTEYLLDTTVFSYMLKQNAKVLTRIASLSTADRLAICSIVRGEVLYGLERLPHGKKKQDLGAKVTELFRALHCEPITALSLRATLITTDSDFRRVTQLDI